MTFQPPKRSASCGNVIHSLNRRDIQAELREWLSVRKWTHFVTLAFNDPAVGPRAVRTRLREWDAKINRSVVGPKWQKRPDERLHWCAFPEKLDAHPHWHLCLEILTEQLEKLRSDPLRTLPFEDLIETHWTSLARSGTVDVQLYEDSGALHYSTKDLRHHATLENFIHSLEFIRI